MKSLKLIIVVLFAVGISSPLYMNKSVYSQGATEAPTGFDTLTNGFADQATHDADRAKFEEVEQIADGLGPIYNAQACSECHQNPVTGAISQITELRAGHLDSAGNFVGATVTLLDGQGNPVIISNRSLINDRAICPNAQFPNSQAQERVPGIENIRTF